MSGKRRVGGWQVPAFAPDFNWKEVRVVERERERASRNVRNRTRVRTRVGSIFA